MEKTTGRYFRGPSVRGIRSVAVGETTCADQTLSETVAGLAQPVVFGGCSAIRGDGRVVVVGTAFGALVAAAAAAAAENAAADNAAADNAAADNAAAAALYPTRL